MAFALWWQALAALFFIAASAFPASAQAQAALRAVPALTAHVIDQTGTLSSSQRQALEAQLAAIEQQHGAQVVVLMVPATGFVMRMWWRLPLIGMGLSERHSHWRR